MKNQVIEVLDIEHGKKVIEYWKSMGFSTTGRNADQTKKSCDTYRYYGVIDNVFDNYNLTKVKNYNAEIIELPTELKNTECVAINEQKNALPSTIEFSPNEDILFLTHEKERLEKELKGVRDANQGLKDTIDWHNNREKNLLKEIEGKASVIRALKSANENIGKDEEKLNTLSAMNESLMFANKKLADDKDYWFNEFNKVQNQFSKFKNAVKSVVLYVDDTE